MNVNWKLKLALAEKFGSQIVASRRLKISEGKLSHIVRGHDQPTPKERATLEQALERRDIFDDTTSEGHAARNGKLN